MPGDETPATLNDAHRTDADDEYKFLKWLGLCTWPSNSQNNTKAGCCVGPWPGRAWAESSGGETAGARFGALCGTMAPKRRTRMP